MSVTIDQSVVEVIKQKLTQPNRKEVEAEDNSHNVGISYGNNLDSNINIMRRTADNNSYRPINTHTLTDKIINPWKRLIRRLIFWYVQPCVNQQTAYNNVNLQAIILLKEALDNTRQQLISSSNEILNQKQLIEKLRIDLNQNQDGIAAMEKQMSSLTSQSARQQIISRRFWLNKNEDAMQEHEYQLSFSQTGEDMIIRYIFNYLHIDSQKCRYLDLGANHAYFLSNTYSFYRDGGAGVLLEANPQLADELRRLRPDDVVINKCLSLNDNQKTDFFIINGDGLSTSNYQAAQECLKNNSELTITQQISVPTITIGTIINEYFKDNAPHILNIDVEGIELDVLKQIDFNQFRPLIIICEMISYRKTLTVGEKNQDIISLMRRHDYIEFAFTGINSIFLDKKSLNKELAHVHQSET